MLRNFATSKVDRADRAVALDLEVGRAAVPEEGVLAVALGEEE